MKYNVRARARVTGATTSVNYIRSTKRCVNVNGKKREEDDDRDEDRQPDTTRKGVLHVTAPSSPGTRGDTRYSTPCAPSAMATSSF